MKIMTGKNGTPHVTSQQFRQLVEGTVGQDSYILTSGECLEPELQTNNLLKIRSGMMSHHGNLSVVDIGTYDEVTIQNGTQGMQRIDLVVNRYTQDEETGVEKNEWIVIMGTPAASDPQVPEYTEGNLQDGDLIDDCPVFEVHLNGINVTEVVKLLEVSPNIPTLNASLFESKILWSHSGMFLNAGQSISLSEKLSNQKRGIVLILSRYESGASQDYGYCTYFVPKEYLDFGVDKPGFDIPLVKYSDGSIVTGSKYIYVSDDKIEGAATNGTSPNSGWVFRYAIGV